jgi:hypothetical protein
VALALATLVPFVPGVANDFVDWDDDLNFVTNPHYRGLGWSQLRWMFTATVTGHYIPVTWMTLGLDDVLWGMNPAGYHLTNLALHALNTVVVALIAIRLLGLARRRTGHTTTLWAGAATAALFFSLHPPPGPAVPREHHRRRATDRRARSTSTALARRSRALDHLHASGGSGQRVISNPGTS